ncbi:MAG: triose-phosphate isomerase [Ignavibacteria bacterium]|jgi:triosephosphate isomerase|nr:triose-phosphate isomerase [Ignavibacteria bacterium]MCU7502767.1 triose-phosphate isomerase [Ignavibacteria bacterium]MCU7518197.1 triose-phosphate isomerase [Ignavibacteria bacterium]
MRKKVIAGNWKMYNDIPASVKLISELKKNLAGLDLKAEVIICPPFTSLDTAKTLIKDSAIMLGAQNMYFEESGAYTGEVSAEMLKSTGCQYVILGHSERRTIFKETDELINKKIKKAILSGLNPIFCVGETLEQRENGTTESVISTQVSVGLSGLSAEDLKKVIVAYEPVWAIGTGKTATPEQAQQVHVFIRSLLRKLYSDEAAEGVTIQYGGSVKPENAALLLSQADIDGALVGGACLKADSFTSIIKSA